MEIADVMNFIGHYTKSGRPVSDLSRFAALMHRLGDPQDKLKFIHAAGTNGKGSVVKMLAEIFKSAGYRTGEYVSPFIYRYNDRIMINGEEIPDELLCDIASEIIPVIKETGESGYSQFEITTAAAFSYFAAMKCDIVILETGLGGLLDCTNIIKAPVCTVITSISYDHTAVLGNTIGEIARHKAGIIKHERPCVLQCGNSPEAETVVMRKAEEEHSEIIIPDRDSLEIISSDCRGNSFVYKGKMLKTSMAGGHQIYNALTAYEAACTAEKYGFDLSEEDIFNGIYKAAVPSRCQIISEEPMTVLDGAHNPDGMRALAEFIRDMPYSPKVMICGMLDSKDRKNTLKHISPYIDKAYCVDGFFNNAVSAEVLAEEFDNGEAAAIPEAYEKAAAYAGSGGLVVIGGSLYMASVLRKYLNML